MMNRTVFLDRDGTINIEKNYLYKTEDFEFIEYAPQAIALLKEHGYRVIVVSNQAGIARGYYTEEGVLRLQDFINSELKKWHTGIDAFYYCPHHPTAGIGKYKIQCRCRKPEIGLFEQASRDFEIEKASSWMIGDKRDDIEAGRRFGVRTIMVRTGYGAEFERAGYQGFDYIAETLYDAVGLILNAE